LTHLNPIWLTIVYIFAFIFEYVDVWICIGLLKLSCNTEVKVNVSCGTLGSCTLKSRGDLWNSSSQHRKLSLPSGNLVITGLFIGVNNMVVAFLYISTLENCINCTWDPETQWWILEICYLGNLIMLCVWHKIQCVFTQFLLHHCMSDVILYQNNPVASEDSKPTEWAVTTTPLSFLSCCKVFPAFCRHFVKIYFKATKHFNSRVATP